MRILYVQFPYYRGVYESMKAIQGRAINGCNWGRWDEKAGEWPIIVWRSGLKVESAAGLISHVPNLRAFR